MSKQTKWFFVMLTAFWATAWFVTTGMAAFMMLDWSVFGSMWSRFVACLCAIFWIFSAIEYLGRDT